MSLLIGKYVFESADNIEGYLQGLGAGQVLQKVQVVSRPSVEINYLADIDEWTISTKSVFKTHLLQFKPGRPTEDESYDVRKCRTTASVVGDKKIVLEQVCDDGPNVTVTKEMNPANGNLVVTFNSGNFTTVHRFRKVVEEVAALVGEGIPIPAMDALIPD